jgi:DNA polymerase
MDSAAGSPGVSNGEADELGALAHALARHARRKQVLGRSFRVAKKPAAPAPAKKAAPSPTPAKEAPRSAASAEARREPARKPASSNSAPAPARTAADVAAQAAAAKTLDELRAAVSVCQACSLCKTRTQTVFMDGEGGRGVLFVGEAPGADEDRKGVPFVGRSGQLLTDIIEKGMGIPRREVHIANVLKCRPPDNREPTPQEKATSTPWLDRQIELLDPKVIIPLGRHAACHVLEVQAPMGAMRQKVHTKGKRKIVPTFHPSYLLRSPGEKKECWKDIQLAMDVLGLSRKGGGSTG